MAVMLICILITLILPMVAKAPVALAMHARGGYDNKHPRAQQDQLEGYGARALAAHKNSFEAIAYFTPAAVTVLALGAIDSTAKWLAISFVVSRLAYLVFYWLNWDILRSIVWVIGFGCSITLLVRLLLAFG
ncbi:MAPEG family protein [Alteromonas facilis]|uniref:MAPEG family protein n=1 Tax=Alteromonas facilis TaxID=2048004 RepID=UPI000C292545|nr:MAPEG family protein [Alteromonas facilis]